MKFPEARRSPDLPGAAGRWLDSFLDLLFPPRCLLCGSLLQRPYEQPACSSCLPLLPLAGFYCLRCHDFHPAPAGRFCGESPPLRSLESLFALSWHEDAWRTLLHRLKYGEARRLSRPLGLWLGLALARQSPWKLDIVVPIPMHRRKLWRRGYNQALLLGCQVARILGLPLVALLEKRRDTPSQTGLSQAERFKNVAGSFALRGKDPRGKTVLLIDDIYTTGATMQEAASLLTSRGAKVYGAVVAFQRRLS